MLKLKITIGIIALVIAYIGLSSPDEVVIDEQGQVKGLANKARKVLQGKNFWENQSTLVQKKLDWNLNEPIRKAEFDRETRQLDAEFNREMNEFYRECPDLKPTRAERAAEALRERADAIEAAEIDREFENIRRNQIAELLRIQQHLADNLK